MSANELELYTRLLHFSIDEGTPDLTFQARLARENGWSRDFTHRVVAEYKRFVFLAMTAGHTVTPSDHVDQAWHLHLTYTRSYWERMCGELLGRPLHHGPTRGGDEESAKYRDQYARTLAAYRTAFGEDPPADVWPPIEVRFGEDLDCVRVNTARNWVVPKAAVRRTALVASIGLVLVCATGCGAVNPFRLDGTGFLLFLIPLLLGSFVLGLVLLYRLRGPAAQAGDDEPKWNWADMAYLDGRGERLTTAAIARLVATGLARVSPDGNYLEAVPDASVPPDLSKVETELMSWMPFTTDALEEVTVHVDRQFADRVAELRDQGYLLSAGRVCISGVVALLPLAAVTILFGGTRLVHGVQTGKPVGFLIFILVVTALVGLVVFVRSMNIRLSRRGYSVRERLRENTSRLLKRNVDPDAVGACVGLYGTGVLAGSSLAELVALMGWYPVPTSSGDDGGGCGGGGCGGGGWGGCGGCGG